MNLGADSWNHGHIIPAETSAMIPRASRLFLHHGTQRNDHIYSTHWSTPPRLLPGEETPAGGRPRPRGLPVSAQGHLCKAHRRAAANLLGSWDSEQVHQLMHEKTEVGSTSGLAEVTHLDQQQVEN